MIERYTRPPMGHIWSLESRLTCLLEVELAVAQAQSEKGVIPQKDFEQIREKATFQVPRILELEKQTKHDVIAFVSNVAENVGPSGRYLHYGMTSSDVLDTALSLQVKKARPVLLQSLEALLRALKVQAQKHCETLCVGRTHGIHAEPTTFGFKMAGFYAEWMRHKKRLHASMDQMEMGKMSGAVGTYSHTKPWVERRVCEILNLKPETIATQVIPRDRHGELFSTFALCAGGLERLSVELRHLQRTEVGEVCEGFNRGQKGSSAMPHKKNPISSENITGCSRILRSYALSAMENMALWHERDISHSSVERVIFPDAFILADYAFWRMAQVVENLQINSQAMAQNMALSQGQIYSSHLLLHLVDQGLSREEAYEKVQSVSHGLKKGESLKEKVKKDSKIRDHVNPEVLEDIFSGHLHLDQVLGVMEQALES